jgi:hypothetical protein
MTRTKFIIGLILAVLITAWANYITEISWHFLLTGLGFYLFGTALAIIIDRAEKKNPETGITVYGTLMLLSTVASALSFAYGLKRAGIIWAVLAFLFWMAWWKRWRKRKKNLLALAGEKSRALIEGLVKRMRRPSGQSI